MSTTTPRTPSKPAPWKPAFLSHLQKMDSPEFVLSTLHPATTSSTSSSSISTPTPYLPRARFCIFRGFWAELPENKHNDAPKNPRVYESDLPTFTSDVRMLKIPEVFATGSGAARDTGGASAQGPEERGQSRGCGGGGPVEAVWWIKDVMTQWRVRGEAFVVGEDVEGGETSGVRTVKNWSWGRELTGHFGNISPGMRGSFRAPPPGRPTSEAYDDKNLKPGMKVEDLHDSYSRRNFRVVIIQPEEVEQLDLSDPATARRQYYTFDKSTGGWNHQELWP
ncbi:hypothetical protein EV356DRAFT_2211 [Viridothelium virens]|uniref:Pyridoxamine 5'-phosphate oxidase Alr4036 family FMN-binding domain-containing protein n=1 Tax=Viridothelium virens TaxID=1048519 RepID=A0A6A6HPU7_VIRVR|nr:hypothetical protein EV356DRAFT_2211 [Viridothelium virens]